MTTAVDEYHSSPPVARSVLGLPVSTAMSFVLLSFAINAVVTWYIVAPAYENEFGFDVPGFVNLVLSLLINILLAGYSLFLSSLIWCERRQRTLRSTWRLLFVVLSIVFLVVQAYGMAVFLGRLGPYLLTSGWAHTQVLQLFNIVDVFSPLLVGSFAGWLATACLRRAPSCPVAIPGKAVAAGVRLGIFFVSVLIAFSFGASLSFFVFDVSIAQFSWLSNSILVFLTATPFAVASSIVGAFKLPDNGGIRPVFISTLGAAVGLMSVVATLLAGMLRSWDLWLKVLLVMTTSAALAFLVLHLAAKVSRK